MNYEKEIKKKYRPARRLKQWMLMTYLRGNKAKSAKSVKRAKKAKKAKKEPFAK